MTSHESLTEPGTLVWVGNTTHAEFNAAFRYCRARVAQLALRRNPQALQDRPAGLVKRVLFTRPDRRPISTAILHTMLERYPGAEFLTLNSALCDGESRTGNPWPVVRHLRFSRWQEVVPMWIEPCGFRQPPPLPLRSTMVICDRFEMAEPYLEIAASLGQTAVWKRNYQPLASRNIGRVIWDDSVAAPAPAEVWQMRLGKSSRTMSSAEHIWLVTQPQANDIAAASSGGVSRVLTKPVTIDQLFECDAPQPSPQ